MVVGTLA